MKLPEYVKFDAKKLRYLILASPKMIIDTIPIAVMGKVGNI
jgi:hypothetical protein